MRAVFFDLDDTLYDRESAVQQVAHGLYTASRAYVPAVTESEFVDRILYLDNHGHADKTQLFQTVAAEWHLGADATEAMLQQFWEMLYRYCRISEDAHVTLRTLRDRGKKLGIITNGSTVSQHRKLESLGVSCLLDVVLISEAEGLRKPDPAMFLRACALCGVNANESVYVGDNPEADIAGALAAGLTAVLKSTPYRSSVVPGVMVIERLSEVLPLCLDGEGAGAAAEWGPVR